MKSLLIFCVVLLVSTSLALAASVTLNKVEYSRGEAVTISIACTGDWLARVLNPEPQLVHIDQGKDSKSISYNTLSSSASGKYSVAVSCQDGSATKEFCVDAPGCIALALQAQPQPSPPPAERDTGGGGGCIPRWSCGQWGLCNATLQKSRSCFDSARCQPKGKIEVLSCVSCPESWICSLWSQCSGGIQSRACIDEHFCGTTGVKPTLQKSCAETVAPGPPPAQVVNLPPEQFGEQYPAPLPPSPIVQQPQPPTNTLAQIWNEYKVWILSALALVVLAAIVITLILVFRKPKERAYNFEELKEWIGKERELGTSDADIRQILMQQTGWHEDEISEAFQELRR